MQAQEFDLTLWSLAQRTGQTREEIMAEFQAGDFVRTHAIRQTWHFVRRADLARVQAATADRVHQASAGMYRNIGLDAETLDGWADWLRSQLADAPMTRVQIRAALAADGRPMENFTMMIALMWAELELIIANGPMRGKAHTYALLDVPKPDRQESITWLVGTFLSSHGPSTVADIAAWCSLTRTDISAALDELRPEQADGTFWLGHQASGPPGIALLNGYDEYISGLSPAGKRRLDPDRLALDRRGTPIHVLLSGGYLTGYWRRTAKGATTLLDVSPRRTLDGAELTGLAAQAEAYADFTGGDVELRMEEQ